MERVVHSKAGSATNGVKPKVTVVMVRSGRAGRGAPFISVKDTPRKKAKLKTISSFWKNQPGNSGKKSVQGRTIADESSLDNSGSFGGNFGMD